MEDIKISLKKALRTIAFTGLIGLSSCNGAITDSTYDFNGNLDNEKIEFKHNMSSRLFQSLCYNKLTVTREDGKTIEYIDLNNDIKLD